jgi:hypothetical protein
LLYSNRKIGIRIDAFKSLIDSEYENFGIDGKIQLNLISQFLGLSLPTAHCVYKSTEHEAAALYFEYSPRRMGTSAESKYEYYFELGNEILNAMHRVGLEDADFIDVHTFIFRDDW